LSAKETKTSRGSIYCLLREMLSSKRLKKWRQKLRQL